MNSQIEIASITKISTLPNKILEVVSEICRCQQSICQCPPIYVVGSTVSYLLRDETLLENTDLDFLMTTDLQAWLQIPSFSKFIRHEKIAEYYIRDTKKYGGTSADLKIQNTTLLESAKKRDFRRSAVFVRANGGPDVLGNVYDPTGLGLHDIYNNLLNTIDEPQICYETDSVRILRTIKYLVRGVTPSHELIEALLEWNDRSCHENDHFYYVLRCQLESSYSIEFIDNLKRYNLVEKIGFADVNNNEPSEVICSKILCELYLRYYKKTIANYKYTIHPFEQDLPPLDMENQRLMYKFQKTWKHHGVAIKREHHASKFYASLLFRINSVESETTRIESEISNWNETLSTLDLAIQKSREELSLKIKTKQELTDNIEFLQKSLIAIEGKTKQLTDQNQQINAKLSLEIDRTMRKKSTEKDNKQLIVKEELIKAKQELERLRKDNSRRRDKIIEGNTNLKKLNLKSLSIEEQIDKLTDCVKQLRKPRLAKDAATAIALDKSDSTIYIENIDAFLDRFNLADLIHLYSITPITRYESFKGSVAYKLASIYSAMQLHMKAFYYIHQTLNLIPDHQRAKSSMDDIQRQLSHIDWTDTTPRSLYKKGHEAYTAKKIDEAILYLLLATKYNPKYINAYYILADIFYKQDKWCEFLYYSKVLDGAEESPKNKIMQEVISKYTQIGINKFFKMRQSESLTERLSGYWAESHIIYNCIEKDIEKLESCYLNIINSDQKKSIEYAMAHQELARISLHENNFKMALHYREASYIFPFLDAKSNIDIKDISADELYSTGLMCRENNCFYSAMNFFKLAIEKAPRNAIFYTAYIKNCYDIKRFDLISQEFITAFYSNCFLDKSIININANYISLAEIYLYQYEYALSRETLQSYGLVDEEKLHSIVLSQQLSMLLIDEVREQQKQCLLLLQADSLYMSDAETALRVSEGLRKIEEDEKGIINTSTKVLSKSTTTAVVCEDTLSTKSKVVKDEVPASCEIKLGQQSRITSEVKTAGDETLLDSKVVFFQPLPIDESLVKPKIIKPTAAVRANCSPIR